MLNNKESFLDAVKKEGHVARKEYGIRCCIFLAALLARQTLALVYCVTNTVDDHQLAPTGALANSGWQQTAPIGNFLEPSFTPTRC